MVSWKNTLGKPSLWLVTGALIVGGVAVANNIRSTSLAYSNSPVLNVRQAGIPGSQAGATLHEVDQALSDVAEQAAKGVVFIRSSDAEGASEGSGFIYRPDGWIVTNDHVVGANNEVTVTLHDGREFKGKVTHANDAQLDLAIIKIDTNDLTPLPLADSQDVRPGQFAIAVGSPFGLNDSVTIGHISGLDRGGGVVDPRFGRRGYVDMLQTDAAINPGNSGGPLLNIDGQVVGVNTTIFTQPSSSMFGQPSGSIGIGFAIQSNVVKVVADELIAKGKFTRGFLGALPSDIKPFKLKELGLGGGAVLEQVTPDSPAEKSGLKPEDIIVEMDGHQVNNNTDVRTLLYGKAPGDSVNIKYRRGNDVKSVNVKLASVPAESQPQDRQTPRDPRGNFTIPNPFGDSGPDYFPNSPDNDGPSVRRGQPRLGVSVQNLDPTVRKQFSIPANASGVVVVTVEPGSFAERVGLKAGDLIQSINGQTMNSIDQVKDAMSGEKWGSKISIVYSRYSNGSVQTNRLDVPLG